MEIIGQGTFGVVYATRSAKGGGPIAVKKIKLTEATQDGFVDEMGCLDALRSKGGHPNVLLFAKWIVDKDSGAAAFLMEAGALDLAKLQRALSYCLPHNIAVQYASEVTHGLAYIHACKVIHRDLKPSNVVLCMSPFTTGRLVAKVADFGCSRLHHARPLQTAGFCTAWYRAPEAFQTVTLTAKEPSEPDKAKDGSGGSAPAPKATENSSLVCDGEVAVCPDSKLLPHDRYGFAADVWSIGCMYAEFLHGKILFQCPGKYEVGLLGTIAARLGPPPEAVLRVSGYSNDQLCALGKAIFLHTLLSCFFVCHGLTEVFVINLFVLLLFVCSFALIERKTKLVPGWRAQQMLRANFVQHGVFRPNRRELLAVGSKC